MKMETRVVHAGEPEPRIGGAAVPPIFQSSVYELSGEPGYHQVVYPRLSNLPNHQVLAGKLASLEGGEAALVAASGMAAISTVLLTVVSNGGHLLIQRTLYGGTDGLMRSEFDELGLEYDMIDELDPASWAAKVRPETRAIYVEAIGNPLLQVPDHRAVVAFARKHGLVSIIDNTFASPVNFRPPEIGFDISVHSATKYLNGHSDLCAGAVIGRADLMEKVKKRMDHLGGFLDPHACFLLHRGMKTLVLRVERQNQTALRIAEHMEKHPRVKRVRYPGLKSHPQHAIAKELFDGFGGMLSFELEGDAATADRFMRGMELPIVGPSLGGVETLCTRPVTTSHSAVPLEERARAGISDTLIRFSVGIEAAEDLIADIDQSLEKAYR